MPDPIYTNPADGIAMAKALAGPASKVLNWWDQQPSVVDKLFGLEGQPRYQTWPERMVRAGVGDFIGSATQPATVGEGETPEQARDKLEAGPAFNAAALVAPRSKFGGFGGEIPGATENMAAKAAGPSAEALAASKAARDQLIWGVHDQHMGLRQQAQDWLQKYEPWYNASAKRVNLPYEQWDAPSVDMPGIGKGMKFMTLEQWKDPDSFMTAPHPVSKLKGDEPFTELAKTLKGINSVSPEGLAKWDAWSKAESDAVWKELGKRLPPPAERQGDVFQYMRSHPDLNNRSNAIWRGAKDLDRIIERTTEKGVKPPPVEDQVAAKSILTNFSDLMDKKNILSRQLTDEDRRAVLDTLYGTNRGPKLGPIGEEPTKSGPDQGLSPDAINEITQEHIDNAINQRLNGGKPSQNPMANPLNPIYPLGIGAAYGTHLMMKKALEKKQSK